VMKANILGLPNLLRFCAGRQIGYNLLPVVAFPVDQSLRSFNNPARQMAGWRESIATARQMLDDLFLPVVPFGERARDLYHGHLNALEGLIPWEKLETVHHQICRPVPPAVLQMYKPERLAGELFAGFLPLENGVAGDCEYYAPVTNGRFDVRLPEGEFLAVLTPRNLSPTPGMRCRWRVAVGPQGELRQSGAPVRTRAVWMAKKWGKVVLKSVGRSW